MKCCLCDAEGSGTLRCSKRSLLPDLMGTGYSHTDPPAHPGSPPKKSRLYKDPSGPSSHPPPPGHSPTTVGLSSTPTGYSPYPNGYIPDPSRHCSRPQDHSPAELDGSPSVYGNSPNTEQENSQHKGNADGAVQPSSAYNHKQGFAHTQTGSRQLVGAESIVSCPQHQKLQLDADDYQDRVLGAGSHDAIPFVGEGCLPWDGTSFDAPMESLCDSQRTVTDASMHSRSAACIQRGSIAGAC